MGARFATSVAIVLVTIGALACKPTQDSGVKNDVAQTETETVKAGTKEILARLAVAADKRVLILAGVITGRPVITIKFRAEAGDATIHNLDLQLAKDANGNQRCESTSAGQACRYVNELAQTELTIQFDRRTNEAKVVAAVWQGVTVPEASIATRNPEPGKGEVGCDLMTGLGCAT